MGNGQLVLLKAVAEGKHFLYELNNAYQEAGYGLHLDWYYDKKSKHPAKISWKKVRYKEYHMACQVQLQRLCGSYRPKPGFKPLLRRVKKRSLRNVVQWAYFLTKEGKNLLKGTK
jgi:hypothetical protein